MIIPKILISETNNKIFFYNENNKKILLGYKFKIIDIIHKNKKIYIKTKLNNDVFYDDLKLLKNILSIKLNINISWNNKDNYFYFKIIDKNTNYIANIIYNSEKINLIDFFNLIIKKKKIEIFFYPSIYKKKDKNYLKFNINSIIIKNNSNLLFTRNKISLYDFSDIHELINSPI